MDHRDVVTRLTVAALLAGLIGTAAVMAQSDGPPPPRTFGSDTTAVGVFTGQGTTTPGLQCDAPPDVSILAGVGDGTFQAAVSYGVQNGPHTIATLDVNRDGRPDLAVSNNGSNSVSILVPAKPTRRA